MTLRLSLQIEKRQCPLPQLSCCVLLVHRTPHDIYPFRRRLKWPSLSRQSLEAFSISGQQRTVGGVYNRNPACFMSGRTWFPYCSRSGLKS